MAATYREAPSRFPGAVVWSSTAGHEATRVLPDGCLDLLWMDDGLWVAGPDTHAKVVPREPGAPTAGLRLAPGSGPLVLGVPAHELRDQRVPLGALWATRRVRVLEERLAASEHPGRVLEEVAQHHRRPPSESESLVEILVALLQQGRPVADVAATVGLSARHLHRVCLDAFGYGPKVLARILRLQRSLALARAGVSFADTAARAGYADQPHLARDVKALAGAPLGELVP